MSGTIRMMRAGARWLLALAVCAGLHAAAWAEAAPAAVRIGVASPAPGIPPVFTSGAVGLAYTKGWLQEAFAGTGTRVEFLFFKGAGPAVNEALTNGQVDFAFQGDLPSIIGRAGGLKTRLLMASGTLVNIYLAVPPDSPVRSLKDLRGKRVALFKGTNSQLPINRLLEANGLSERDIRTVNLDNASAKAALVTRDIDAVFGGYDLLQLRDAGQARIVYSSRGDSPVFTRQSHLLATESFASRYPDATQRVVTAVVRAAHWGSEDAHRDETLALWARMGVPQAHLLEDLGERPVRARLSPLFDPFLVARYQDAVEQAPRFRLTRTRFAVEPWIDRRFLDRALTELKLEHYWTANDAQGRALAAAR